MNPTKNRLRDSKRDLPLQEKEQINTSKNSFLRNFKRELPLHLMILPGLILVLVFSYTPMYGLIIAFQRFIPAFGMFGAQQWVGLDNFTFVMNLAGFQRAFVNTVIIAFWRIVTVLLIPIIFALLLNEVRSNLYRRTVQTITYMPFFLSWVILGGIFVDMLSPSDGLVNSFLGLFGVDPIFFLGDNNIFRGTLVVTNVWREFGFGAIVYLAAITSIDPTYYEAAVMDGANRWKQTWHITLPGMKMIIVLMGVLSLGNVLNAGFDQVFNMYSPVVFASGDIIDTFIFRMGLIDAQFGPATAVGLFRSIISFLFISVSYFIAYKTTDYRIF